MIRAVIGTNVLVSGLLSPSGNEALIVLALHQGLVCAGFSEEIIDEHAAVLARPKCAFPPDEIDALIATVRRNGELFHPDASAVSSPDPGDTKFLQCAEASGADFIITGNKRLFPLALHGRARVVNAGEMLDRITEQI